jgi:lysozyme
VNINQMLEAEEDRRACVYQDSLGYWTIGIGRLVDKRKPGAGLSDDEIDYLLANDVREKTAQVRAKLPWFDRLNEARQAVIVGMAFQLGMDGLLGFKVTLANIATGRWEQAAAGMLASLWAKQTPARAKRMAEQMRTGIWQIKQ